MIYIKIRNSHFSKCCLK